MIVVRPAIPVTDPVRRHRWTWAQNLLLLAALLLLAGSLGCGGAIANDAVTPSNPTAPAISLSPSSVTFGDVNVGATGSQTVTLTNTGNAALGISGLRIAGDFTESHDCGASMAAGSACHITVTFKPTTVGAATGTLTISDNAAGSPHQVPLSGTGVNAPTPSLTVSPGSLSFASQVVKTTSAAQAVKLSNSGTASLSISGIAVTGDFAQTNNCGSSLAASSTCTVNVTFTPTQSGTRTGTLTITDNAGNSPQQVAISGTGTAAVIAVTVSPASAAINTGATYQFSASVTGTTNTAVTWSVVSGGGTISTTGLYTAPTSATTATIKATSVADTSKSDTSTVTVNAPATVSVNVSPSTASINTGATYQFSASVTGTTNTAVTWSVVSGGGTISTTGLYTAPTSATTATIKATSVADTTKSDTSTVTVNAPATVAVNVSPSSASINTGATYQFSASVTGTTNTAVTWSVVSGGGTISTTGLYTAPTSATTATIKATSVADTTKSDTSTVTVTAPATVAVNVSPSSASINTGATYQFSASVTGTTNTAVTWSVVSGGGTISAAGLYTAPSSATTATIKATSVADTSKGATATISVTTPVTIAVTVSPSTAAVSTGGTVQFTASVTGSTAGVSWSVVSGGGTISSSGLYTAPSTSTTAVVKAVSNSDALANDTASVTVTAPASGNAGCGATGTYPNLVPSDQSACGNVSADGSPLSYEPGYNDSSATAISCGSTVRSNGSYKLNANLSCGAGSLAFQISPASGANNILINLNGHSVSGYIQVNEDGGHVAGGIHVFNGSIACNTSSANGGACIFVTTSNGAAPPSAANVFHHLTIQNSADSSSAFMSDGSYSSPMAGAQVTGGAYSDVYHHLTITVVGGTITGNRAGGGGVAGNNRTVHYYNLKITNGDSNTNHYTEGIDCYDTYNCDVHNNYFAPNRITTGDTPGRMILLDGDAYGNGSCSTCMTQNAHVHNNYFNANDVRAIRHRSAKNVNAHDNLMDNVQDPPANISNSGVVHFGDMTSAGPGGTGVYDLGNSVYKNNVIVFAGPIHGAGPKAFADGFNAKGVTFTDNRIMCSGTGCSGITDPGHAVNVGSQGLGSPRYADVKACNFTFDSPLPTPLHIDGSSETQTSYLRNNNAGTCTASAGAQCVAISSCQ